MKSDRRNFIKQSIVMATGLGVTVLPGDLFSHPIKMEDTSFSNIRRNNNLATIRFSTIGLNHAHINSQTDAMIRAGAELVAFYAKEPELADQYSKRYPHAKLARSEKEILEDNSIQLVISASIPSDRAPLGIEVMRHGKDFMVDKPGITTLEQLADVRRVQKETKRIYSIMYSERFENRATVKAGELVKSGAIGQVIQTIGNVLPAA